MIGRNRTGPSPGRLFGQYTLQTPLSWPRHLVWPPRHLVLATGSEAVRSTDVRPSPTPRRCRGRVRAHARACGGSVGAGVCTSFHLSRCARAPMPTTHHTHKSNMSADGLPAQHHLLPPAQHQWFWPTVFCVCPDCEESQKHSIEHSFRAVRRYRI